MQSCVLYWFYCRSILACVIHKTVKGQRIVIPYIVNQIRSVAIHLFESLKDIRYCGRHKELNVTSYVNSSVCAYRVGSENLKGNNSNRQVIRQLNTRDTLWNWLSQSFDKLPTRRLAIKLVQESIKTRQTCSRLHIYVFKIHSNVFYCDLVDYSRTICPRWAHLFNYMSFVEPHCNQFGPVATTNSLMPFFHCEFPQTKLVSDSFRSSH